MNDEYNIIKNSKEIPEICKYYWGYQFQLAKKVLVPMLMKQNAFKSGFSVAEIGSAEGGVLAAFVSNGAKNALGTDIVQSRLELGKKISSILNLPIEFSGHDIISEPLKPEWQNKFDLVLLRDVIEHLDDTDIALKNIKNLIKPGGYLYVTFPPYHSPYGGHQHTVNNFMGKFPYIHLLPNKLFYSLIASGRANDIEEVKRLQNIRLTADKLIESATNQGYEIDKVDYYFFRPVFKMKFGLPAIKINFLSFLPFIKKYFSLEASFLLKTKNNY